MEQRLRYLILLVVLVVIVNILVTLKTFRSNNQYSPLNLFHKYQQLHSQLWNITLSKQKLEFPNKKNNSRKNLSFKTDNSGNPLIHNYGKNNLSLKGENGSGVILKPNEEEKAKIMSKGYNVNVYISDLIPLNRMVPDSRPVGCKNQMFDESHMPQAAVIITVYNEWPTILLRTIYSIINRTPRNLLKEIIIVDDNSDLEFYKEDLDIYIKEHFDTDLVKLIRLKERGGLIKTRVEAIKYVTAEVVCILESHMEVNINWLQPLLVEIMKNRSTLAMGQLDYIDRNTFKYEFDRDYKPRYGFNWNFVFYETYFRPDQMLNKKVTDTLPGPVIVGAGFAMDVKFFRKIGLYDSKMTIWGGENLELSWRVWCCGGQVLHVFCSHFGHIARSQPYSFPRDRLHTEAYNYKRAVEVWFGPYKKYVYNYFPLMMDIDVGDLSDRLRIKNELKCKNFDWYLDNIWPDLFRFDVNVTASGELKSDIRNFRISKKKFVFSDKTNNLYEAINALYDTLLNDIIFTKYKKANIGRYNINDEAKILIKRSKIDLNA
ncbi:polypeptide N-acetylgalactosaminyltransferase 13 [Octopus bimaculoides]|uniref:polypeptide N-acetylgalactosaminyltransferase 13 n=1 Tax=Octopus bimaculoides TaxID=37653 RepID=UPI00071D5CAA|nr:polypeptide N-acetylgalactosaminyltransferase 13 [Octopus bimaculoides]|eukprot:XP_014784702.1 PREDICTED: polypeptide N-acetylgalactosaminyltransferase 13-like [Octopus bimaculoides]